MPKVLFRADARIDLGTGHVMRCMTLAHHLRADGWEAAFATVGESMRLCPGLSDFPLFELSRSATVEEELAVATRGAFDLVVVDHYERDANLETELRRSAKVFVIDDLANRAHDCHVLMDQTPGRQPVDYVHCVPEYCRLLLGGDYALLRPEFSELRAESLSRRDGLTEPRSLLVTCGGTDHKGASLLVIDALAETQYPFEVTLVLPSVSPHFHAAREKLANWSHPSTVALVDRVSNMAELMVATDIAIGAGGTTSWERCCLGVPCLNLKIAENQVFVNQVLRQSGAIIDLGDVESLSPGAVARNLDALAQDTARLRAMSVAARNQIDGMGCSRVSAALAELLRT